MFFFGINTIPKYFGLDPPIELAWVWTVIHTPFDTLYDLLFKGEVDNTLTGFEVKRVFYAFSFLGAVVVFLLWGNKIFILITLVVIGGVLLRLASVTEITPFPGEVVATSFDSISGDGKPILDVYDKVARVVTKYWIAILITIAVLFFLGWRIKKMTKEDWKKVAPSIFWAIVIGIVLLGFYCLVLDSTTSGGNPIWNLLFIVLAIGALLIVLYKPSDKKQAKVEKREED